MTQGADSGFAVVPTVLSAFLGLLLALIGSFAIVQLGTAEPTSTVDKPLITYDSQ